MTKKRYSSEYTMLCILEYLYTKTQTSPVTKYNITNSVVGIKQQRSDRIDMLLITLEKNGYVLRSVGGHGIFYQITQAGTDAYSKWIKDFLEFTRKNNQIRSYVSEHFLVSVF